MIAGWLSAAQCQRARARFCDDVHEGSLSVGAPYHFNKDKYYECNLEKGLRTFSRPSWRAWSDIHRIL